MSQERKKELVISVRKMLKEKYPDIKVKCTFAVEHHSSITMNIMGCSIDLLADYLTQERIYDKHVQVNLYWIDNYWLGRTGDLLRDCAKCLNEGNHDNSDIQTDYFDVGWYTHVNIGKWDKPFQVI